MNIKQAKELLRLAYRPECRKSQVILLLGSPGIGKTQCITELAQELGVHAEFLICSQMLPNEICGSGIPSKDGKVWEMYDVSKTVTSWCWTNCSLPGSRFSMRV